MKRMISPEALKDSLPSPPSPAETTFAPLLIGDKNGETKVKVGVLNTSEIRFTTQDPYSNDARTIEFDPDYQQIFFQDSPKSVTAKLRILCPKGYESVLWLYGSDKKDVTVFLPFNNIEDYSKIPAAPDPTEDGTYTLKLVKSGSSITYTWAKDV